MIRYITQDRQALATNLNVSRFKEVSVHHTETLDACPIRSVSIAAPLTIGAAQILWMV